MFVIVAAERGCDPVLAYSSACSTIDCFLLLVKTHKSILKVSSNESQKSLCMELHNTTR